MAGGYDLKNEAEVKLFLDNLGVEYRFGCYSEKNPEACHLLGDYLEAVKKDFEKAWSVYHSTCNDLFYAKSCLKAGNYLFAGKGGVSSQPTKALSYFSRGCELGSPEACLNAGLLCVGQATTPKGLSASLPPKDFPQALSYLEKACTGDNTFACYFLSGIYISGSPGAVKKDMVRAHDYSLRACDLGNAYACANLSQMYHKGEGVAADPVKAEKYRKKAQDIQEQHTKGTPLTFQQGVASS